MKWDWEKSVFLIIIPGSSSLTDELALQTIMVAALLMTNTPEAAAQRLAASQEDASSPEPIEQIEVLSSSSDSDTPYKPSPTKKRKPIATQSRLAGNNGKLVVPKKDKSKVGEGMPRATVRFFCFNFFQSCRTLLTFGRSCVVLVGCGSHDSTFSMV